MIKRLLAGLFGIVFLAATFAAGNVLLSMDWERTHRAETAELPVFRSAGPDGLYQVKANGFVFRARIFGAGNAGPGIVMLHGHPETSIMWEPVAKAAAEEGYRVIAFDQRGYSPGARPKGVGAYKADNQIADVMAIADAMGFEEFHLVGHDWGAVIAWATAILAPERLISLSTMSIPHPQTLKAMVVDDPPSYIRLFSLPWVPEAMLLFNELAGYKKWYTEQSDAQIEEYIKVFSEPGAATATLNWYRSIQDSVSLVAESDATISLPTLFIYGDQEMWVTPAYLTEQATYMAGPYQTLELKAGHWLVQKHPDVVTSAVLDHVRDSRNAAPDASAD
ncbi:MAG: alpha/beta hydrolase [Pseudomonadota bacterium]